MEESERIHNFDFLRGGFVLLALIEHFCYYLNVWYATYFREHDQNNPIYEIHWEHAGQFLAMDEFIHFLGVIFIPWVSQVYLTLATFNLAKRNQFDFIKTYKQKLQLFVILFFFFFFENFLVAPDFGLAISIYPLMTWMVVLALLTLAYRWTNIYGVYFLFLLSFSRFVIPWEFANTFEQWMGENVHQSFEYDARLQYFLSSGCLGFILGHLYHHRTIPRQAYYYTFISLGLLGLFIWVTFGRPFYVEYVDILATEHLLIKTFSGTMGILGIQLIVLVFFLFLEGWGIRLKNIPLFSWVGRYSILVFAFHRIFFVKIWMPVAVFVFGLFNSRVVNNWEHIFLAVLGSVLFSWVIHKTQIFKYVTKT